MCKTDVTLQTGATMNGRLLSQTQVALQQATVTQPAP
ncbi:ice-binding family protein [Archangium sp.]